MKYDMIVTDYDGTLGNGPNIQPQTLDAIDKFIKKGGKFVICTGRMKPGITCICEKYNMGGIVVCYQGAVVYDLDKKVNIREGGLDKEFAIRVVRDMHKEELDFVVDINDKMYCERQNMYTEYHKDFTEIVEVGDMEKYISGLDDEILYKVVAVGNPEKILPLTKKYSEIYKDKAICNNGSDVLLEIINPAYSKGASVRFLSEHFNIPYEKIMAVGDSTNDIELISGEWHGVAVGDAKDELKAVAKEVTVPFSEQPIKTLIEKYCL